MSFLQLPTDNLYKFMAIVGLLLMATGFLVPEYFELQLVKTESIYSYQMLHLDARFKETQNSMKFNLELYDGVTKEIDRDTESIKKAKSISRIKEIESQSQQRANELNKLEEKNYELLHEADSIREKTVALSETYAFLSFLKNKIKSIRILSLVFISTGILFTILGFSLWYFKVQRYQDNEIKSNFEKALLGDRRPLYPLNHHRRVR